MVNAKQGETAESREDRIAKWNNHYNKEDLLLNDKKGRFIQTFPENSKVSHVYG